LGSVERATKGKGISLKGNGEGGKGRKNGSAYQDYFQKLEFGDVGF